MPSLAEQLSQRYVDQMYRGAMFQHGNEICQLVGHTGNGPEILVASFGLNDKDPVWMHKHMDGSCLTSMDDFAWPRLGYRDIIRRGSERHTYFISMSRSAMRGLRMELLQYDPVPVTALFSHTHQPGALFRTEVLAQAIFNKKYISFDDGLRQIRDGKIGSFALSDKIAVGIAAFNSDNTIEVYYNQRVIGHVTDRGEVVIPHKLARKASSARLFNYRIRA